eukprot:c7932_g1_i1.p1 GENE.c7932_g1_i1~~c7932_g1_i1.p1  ORF type:complete len:112 (+),score=16.33 c7932_g1_i1:113-448(+)
MDKGEWRSVGEFGEKDNTVQKREPFPNNQQVKRKKLRYRQKLPSETMAQAAEIEPGGGTNGCCCEVPLHTKSTSSWLSMCSLLVLKSLSKPKVTIGTIWPCCIAACHVVTS